MSRRPAADRIYARVGKRALDALGSALLIIVTGPLHAACAAAVLVCTGRPVYFHQVRTGFHGQEFRLHKLRTMSVGTAERFGGYPTEAMITSVGGFLRRWSLDELPQLFNILRGDMGFVGPRPALPDQVCRYTAEQRRRLEVRPGLTGLAQVRHRNNAPWSVRIKSDIEYVENVSLREDLRLLLATVPVALTGADQVVGQTAADVDDLGSPESSGPLC